MNYLFIFLAALLSSIATAIVIHLRSAHGTLRIDHTDPEKDIYRIEIDNLDALRTKSQVILMVDNDAVLPHSQE